MDIQQLLNHPASANVRHMLLAAVAGSLFQQHGTVAASADALATPAHAHAAAVALIAAWSALAGGAKQYPSVSVPEPYTSIASLHPDSQQPFIVASVPPSTPDDEKNKLLDRLVAARKTGCIVVDNTISVSVAAISTVPQSDAAPAPVADAALRA